MQTTRTECTEDATKSDTSVWGGGGGAAVEGPPGGPKGTLRTAGWLVVGRCEPFRFNFKFRVLSPDSGVNGDLPWTYSRTGACGGLWGGSVQPLKCWPLTDSESGNRVDN